MSRISVMSALLLGSLAVSAACAKNQSANANTAPRPMMGMGVADHQQMGPGTMGTMGVGDSCPATVPGTSAQATDTADGIAMTFTTTGDIQDLRKRARAMADRMNERSDAAGAGGSDSRTSTGGAMMGGGMMGGAITLRNTDAGDATMGGPMPATHTRAEDVPGGARIAMAPRDPYKAEEWRRRMWDTVLDMTEGRACPTPTAR
jgi:hypothetical protein